MSGRACDVFEPLVAIAQDGELDAREQAALDGHLEGCAACRLLRDEQAELEQALRHASPLWAPRPELRRQVARLGHAPGGSSPGSFRAGLAVAAAAAVLVFASVGHLVRPSVPVAPVPSPLAEVAAATHRAYVESRLPLDVRTGRTSQVAQWLSDRLPFRVVLPDYAMAAGRPKPYAVVGGRLVALFGRESGFVAYEVDGRPVSLLVASALAVQPGGGVLVPSGKLIFHVSQVSGLKVVTWTDRDITYALVSPLDVEGGRSCVVCHAPGSAGTSLRQEPGLTDTASAHSAEGKE